MSDDNVYIGVDVGGSHVAVGLVNEDGALIYTEELPIEGSSQMEPSALVSLIVELVSQVMEEFQSSGKAKTAEDVQQDSNTSSWWLPFDQTAKTRMRKLRGLGIGCPGQSKNGVLVAASNFPLFKNVPIVDMLHGYTFLSEIPIILVNDADAAVAAEVWAEKSKDAYAHAQNVAMITIGTGIGVGLVLNGRLYQGSNGCVEAGHLIVDTAPGATLCGCGQRGCVEVYASARNISRIYNDRLSAATGTLTAASANAKANAKASSGVEGKSDDSTHAQAQAQAQDPLDSRTTRKAMADGGARPLLLSQVERDGMSVAATGGTKHIFRIAAADPNSIAAQTLDDACRHIAVLCINLCRVVDPSIIIIGGGVSKAGEPLLRRIRDHIRTSTWTVLPTDVVVVAAQGLENAGIIGAALASKDHASHSSFGASRKRGRTYSNALEGISDLDSGSGSGVWGVMKGYLRSTFAPTSGWYGYGLWGLAPVLCVGLGYALSKASSPSPSASASASLFPSPSILHRRR